MATIQTYANNLKECFCCIRLDSGEHVLISIAAAPTPSTKILQMAFFGMIPWRVIWELNPETARGFEPYAERLKEMFLSNRSTVVHPLDCMRDFVIEHGSIERLRLALVVRELVVQQAAQQCRVAIASPSTAVA